METAEERQERLSLLRGPSHVRQEAEAMLRAGLPLRIISHYLLQRWGVSIHPSTLCRYRRKHMDVVQTLRKELQEWLQNPPDSYVESESGLEHLILVGEERLRKAIEIERNMGGILLADITELQDRLSKWYVQLEVLRERRHAQLVQRLEALQGQSPAPQVDLSKLPLEEQYALIKERREAFEITERALKERMLLQHQAQNAVIEVQAEQAGEQGQA